MDYDFRQEIVLILEQQFHLPAFRRIRHIAQGHGGEIVERHAVGRRAFGSVQHLGQVLAHLVLTAAETAEVIAEHIADPDAARTFHTVIQDGEAQNLRVLSMLPAAENRLIAVSVAPEQPGAVLIIHDLGFRGTRQIRRLEGDIG